jgi:uncharacterized C2H2 Zn-finger protein
MNFEEMIKYSDPFYVSNLKPEASNETVIVDNTLPKTWKCPHCDKVNKMDRQAENIFMHEGIVLRGCPRCSWVHVWKLELTEEFKKKVVRCALDMAGVNKK